LIRKRSKAQPVKALLFKLYSHHRDDLFSSLAVCCIHREEIISVPQRRDHLCATEKRCANNFFSSLWLFFAVLNLFFAVLNLCAEEELRLFKLYANYRKSAAVKQNKTKPFHLCWQR
jgi:hypothetical protein